jgi:hypothetical protein
VWTGQLPVRLAALFGQTGADLRALVEDWHEPAGVRT